MILWIALMGCNGGEEPTVEELGLTFEEVAVSDEIHLVTDFAFLPGTSDELVAVTILGEVAHYRLDDSGLQQLSRHTVAEAFTDQPGCGVISVAPAPDYGTSKQLYLGTCTGVTSTAILRATFDDTAGLSDTVSIISFEESAADEAWHQVGTMGFDGDVLYFGMGEMTIRSHAQDPSDALGAIVRIIPTATGYEPAPDNPFIGDATKAPEVYAYGLRSPWTTTVDDKGRYWVADVGSVEFEEVNLVGSPGDNMGWPEAEGPCSGDCDGFVDPVVSWSRESSTNYVKDDDDALPAANSLGWVASLSTDGPDPYDGALNGSVLFGDMCYGWMRQLTVDDDGKTTSDVHFGHLDYVAGVRRGPDGYAYFGNFGMCLAKGDPGPWSLWKLAD
jgi:glucose/arabinose dehydrogenase